MTCVKSVPAFSPTKQATTWCESLPLKNMWPPLGKKKHPPTADLQVSLKKIKPWSQATSSVQKSSKRDSARMLCEFFTITCNWIIFFSVARDGCNWERLMPEFIMFCNGSWRSTFERQYFFYVQATLFHLCLSWAAFGHTGFTHFFSVADSNAVWKQSQWMETDQWNSSPRPYRGKKVWREKPNLIRCITGQSKSCRKASMASRTWTFTMESSNHPTSKLTPTCATLINLKRL